MLSGVVRCHADLVTKGKGEIMKLSLQVVKVDRETYESKNKGHIDQQIVMCVDADKGGVDGLFKFVPDDQSKMPKFGDILEVAVRNLYATKTGFNVVGSQIKS